MRAWPALIVCCLGAAVLAGERKPASRGVLSEHEIERIVMLGPQQQAEWLLERVVNRYEGAHAMLMRLAPGWQGRIRLDEKLNALLDAAYNSSELSIRDAAIEVTLAGRNTARTADTVDALDRAIAEGTGDQAWNLWTLGMLGRRGVETGRVRQILADRLRDPTTGTRYWAVKALALLGSDKDMAYLLWVFRNDSDPGVRERAACSVAESGMFSRQQRYAAIPELLRMMDDPGIDSETRNWVFQALRDVSGQGFRSSPADWHDWYGREPRRQGSQN
ncbi:MAG: HEAT repeat domain-containing protein [Bryobacteraceae bacterium]